MIDSFCEPVTENTQKIHGSSVTQCDISTVLSSHSSRHYRPEFDILLKKTHPDYQKQSEVIHWVDYQCCESRYIHPVHSTHILPFTETEIVIRHLWSSTPGSPGLISASQPLIPGTTLLYLTTQSTFQILNFIKSHLAKILFHFYLKLLFSHIFSATFSTKE